MMISSITSRLKFALALGLLTQVGTAFSQQSPASTKAHKHDGETVEYCISHHLLNDLKKDPKFVAQAQLDEAKQELAYQSLMNSSNKRGTVYKIPIVFHVIHNNGTENISDEQILDALRILNRDYAKLNADTSTVVNSFKNIIGKAEIEFVLATKAPNGACFSGITRTVSHLTVDSKTDNYNGEDQVNAIVAGNDVYNGQWPPNKYLNVYIAKVINGAAGYTFKPGTWSGSSMYYNGIFMLSDYTGSIGTSSAYSSRALTHEVGHWLNLSHTWGDTNDPGISCGDDNVADTPETKGSTSCNLNNAECGPLANVENYMDYSYCSKMFTVGQVNRMRAALTSSVAGRSNLWKEANLSATTGLCEPIFSATTRIVCAGESIDFSNKTVDVTGLNWSFAGGSPSTSTQSDQTVVYHSPGTYPVSLTATDGTVTATNNQVDYVIVLPHAAYLNFFENFENYSSTQAITTLRNTSFNGPKWELYTGAGSSGNKSFKLENFTIGAGAITEFTSAPVDLSTLAAEDKATFSFRYAYKRKTGSGVEVLRIVFSKDCGESWQAVKSLTGSSLSNEYANTAYTPAPADWKTVHTNIAPSFFVDNFRYAFRFSSNGGNNVYIDDINVYKGDPTDNLGIDEVADFEGLTLYPNPAEDVLNISFEALSSTAVVVEMTDLTGKVLESMQLTSQVGENLVILNTQKLSAGMYFTNIKTQSGTVTKSFIVK